MFKRFLRRQNTAEVCNIHPQESTTLKSDASSNSLMFGCEDLEVNNRHTESWVFPALESLRPSAVLLCLD